MDYFERHPCAVQRELVLESGKDNACSVIKPVLVPQSLLCNQNYMGLAHAAGETAYSEYKPVQDKVNAFQQ